MKTTNSQIISGGGGAIGGFCTKAPIACKNALLLLCSAAFLRVCAPLWPGYVSALLERGSQDGCSEPAVQQKPPQNAAWHSRNPRRGCQSFCQNFSANKLFLCLHPVLYVFKYLSPAFFQQQFSPQIRWGWRQEAVGNGNDDNGSRGTWRYSGILGIYPVAAICAARKAVAA